jgi:hypothetical protein
MWVLDCSVGFYIKSGLWVWECMSLMADNGAGFCPWKDLDREQSSLTCEEDMSFTMRYGG